MSNTFEEFSRKFRIPDLLIHRWAHWTWSIRPVHNTLGSGILSLNRFSARFGELTTDEAGELAFATKEIERRISVAFQPDKFNYLMLMMVDAHVHFHVIPRYAKPRNFAGTDWVDDGWPTLPSLSDGSGYENDPLLLRIRDTLR